jgi:hypothetical protein
MKWGKMISAKATHSITNSQYIYLASFELALSVPKMFVLRIVRSQAGSSKVLFYSKSVIPLFDPTPPLLFHG